MARMGLSTESVVTAAAQIADSAGLDALTLAAVATAVGVKTPSLYAHVRGLDDLRDRLRIRGAQQLGEALAPAAAGLSRGRALTEMARVYRLWALEHPGLYAALQIGAPREDPATDRILTLVLAVLRGYGLVGDDAIHAARTVRAALHGFITLEAAAGFGIAVDLAESFNWMLRAIDRGLSAS